MQSSPDNGDGSSSAAGELNPWPNPGAVDQLFDYASFMWDAGGDALGNFNPVNSADGWIVRHQFLYICFWVSPFSNLP